MKRYLNPNKYFTKIRSWRHEKNYSLAYRDILKAEVRKFEKCQFRYEESLERLNRVLNALGKPDFAKDTDSVHWLLFACISGVFKVGNILEIGTYTGEATLLLSKLFPTSRITTIDLPDDDPVLVSTYKRGDPDKLKIYKEQQKKNLVSPQITFLQINSFFIPSVIKEKFDLVWIDGGHLYPEIAWDICNAYHLTNKGGYIMCDDVITNNKGFRNEYVSSDSCSVLEYMGKRIDEDITYFLKREAPAASADPKKRKYIALMRRV